MGIIPDVETIKTTRTQTGCISPVFTVFQFDLSVKSSKIPDGTSSENGWINQNKAANLLSLHKHVLNRFITLVTQVLL